MWTLQGTDPQPLGFGSSDPLAKEAALCRASARAFGQRGSQPFCSGVSPHGQLEKTNGSFLSQVLVNGAKRTMIACQPSNYSC